MTSPAMRQFIPIRTSDLDQLQAGLRLGTGDAPLERADSVDQLVIHRAALRLRSIDATVPGCDPRSPFLALWESARAISATTHVTVWLRWGGALSPKLDAHLLLSTVDVDASELNALVRVTTAMFGTGRSPWHIEAVDPDELDVPVHGDVRFIRQTRSTVPVGDGVQLELPLRFAYPGPGAWDRLLAALAAVEQRVDLAITITPTSLAPDEEAELDELMALRDETDFDPAARRVWATLADAAASYRTDPALIQVMLVGDDMLADSEIGAIASTITAPFDTTNGDGYRVAASPQRFIGGGYEIDPARNPDEVLRAFGSGRPWVGTTGRGLCDLVTCDELSFLLSWPLSSDGDLPGIPSGAGLERLDTAQSKVNPEDAVSLGRLGDGQDLMIGVRDRTQHVAVLGASGSGKSTLLLHLALQDVRAGRTTWIIDSSGDLLHRIAASIDESERDRLFILDVTQPNRSKRLDLLRPSRDETQRNRFVEAVHDGLVADVPAEFHGPVGRQNLLAVMRLMAATDVPLERIGGMIADESEAMELLARIADDDSSIANDPTSANDVDTVKLMHRAGRESNAELHRWLRSKPAVLAQAGLREVFSGSDRNVWIEDLIAPGAVVLIRTPEDADGSHLLTSMLLELFAAATSRRTLADHPIALYLEEIQRAAGGALRHVLNESRKRNVCCHLATQHLQNLEDEAEGVLTNSSTILCGRSRGHSGRRLERDLDLPDTALRSLPNLTFMGSTAIGGEQIGPVRITVPPMGTGPTGWPDWLSAPRDDSRSTSDIGSDTPELEADIEVIASAPWAILGRLVSQCGVVGEESNGGGSDDAS